MEDGEIINFVVDCGKEDNFSCDGFVWAPEITSITDNVFWSATAHFSGNNNDSVSLSAWERFSQALLISNEVMFLD